MPVQPKTKAPPHDRHARPPLQRMTHIHTAIRNGRYPNASSLAKELEVSPKSIMRDITFMRDQLRLPLDYDKQKWGYYYTEKTNEFPSLQVTEGELFALLVAEKALQQYRGTSFERPLVSAFSKMTKSLGDTISFNLDSMQQTISFKTSAEPILNDKHFELIARAVAKREQLILSYRKPGKQTVEQRKIDPYHLANINGDWFLFAHCHLRKDIRTFVPSRIQSIERTGSNFRFPKNFSLEKNLRDSFGVHSGREEIQIIVQFDDAVGDYIREKIWHPSQKLRELPKGGVELELKLSSLGEIRRWILGWGHNARVIAPQELAQSIRDTAAGILLKYTTGEETTKTLEPENLNNALHSHSTLHKS
ncbi:MAG: helix-turn-helix transcriptional regulator [Verrucomicrobiales bacterium]